jgi:plasmid stabilization system protein ParE
VSGYTVIIEPDAARDFDAVGDWLRRNRGAARAAVFEDEFARGLRLLEDFPFLYAVMEGSEDVHRMRLKKSRYHVFYRVLPEAKRISVLRVRHEARRPLKRL